MHKWTLGYGEPNYQVRLTEVPLWRVVVEESYVGCLSLLGHPCCWSLKWVPGERLRDWVAVAQYRLLNNRFAMAASGHRETTVDTLEISEQRAYQMAPDFVTDMRDIFDEDDDDAGQTVTLTSSTAAAVNLTWTSSMPSTTVNP